MASDNEFASDSLDQDINVTTFASDHLDYLKKRLANYLLESKDLSAEIHHLPGQTAKLTLTFGSTRAKKDEPAKYRARPSHHLLVTDLPESTDEEHLEMFFEHTKRQGGGPVKSVSLTKDKKSAIIEFEDPEAVQRVLNKQPIKMLGKTVQVEICEPYLDKGELLESVEIRGINSDFVQEIAGMKARRKVDEDQRDGDDNDDDKNETDDTDDSDEDLFGTLGGRSKMNDQFETPFGRNLHHFGADRNPYLYPYNMCDGCKWPMVGTRYRCQMCPDFNFCSSCKETVPHNPTHNFKAINHLGELVYKLPRLST